MGQVNTTLTFCGMQLPVIKGEDGIDRIPLKPIVVDIFELKWETQREKVQEQAERLGIAKGTPPASGALRKGTPSSRGTLGKGTPSSRGTLQAQEMVCIRVDKVASFLFMISTNQVRARGNVSGAAFLKQKQDEWDAVLYEYERMGGSGSNGTPKAQRDTTDDELIRLSYAITRTRCPALQETLYAAFERKAIKAGLPFQAALKLSPPTKPET